jgi:DNA-directed RNA polymerase specialized sigma24 family protein
MVIFITVSGNFAQKGRETKANQPANSYIRVYIIELEDVMENVMALSKLYRDYKNGLIGRTVFEAKLMGEVTYRAPSVLGKNRSKNLQDFLVWLYPRLHNAIDNYKNTGSDFDRYLYTIVRKAYKEFHMKEHDHRITERTVWTEKSYEFTGYEYAVESAAEREAFYAPDSEDDKPEPFRCVSNPRQILILLMKSYYFLSDDFISRIAPALGMDREEINMLVTEMRDLRAEREQEIHDLRERVHTQFYRCLSFQYRAEAAPANSARQLHYRECLNRGLKRLSSMRQTLRNLNVDASNKEIAEVLGISKGTVDASLFTVKKSYARTLSGLSTSAPSV